MKLTKRHRANLRKHAKYLYALPDNSKFDMKQIALDGHGFYINYACDVHECGAVMCSIGYAALCFPRIAKKHTDWVNFCYDVFGMEHFSEGWDFLFSAKWSRIDNTITGAADRITYFLKYGVPSDNWNPEVYRQLNTKGN